MVLEFRPLPIPEQQEAPNEGLQILDKAAQMAQIFHSYQQQKQATEMLKQQRAADFAQKMGEGGEDFMTNYRAILAGKPVVSPAAAPFAAKPAAPQPTQAPAQPMPPGPMMSMAQSPDPYSQYQSVQDPFGPLPGMGVAPEQPMQPGQSMAAPQTPMQAPAVAEAPAGPKSATEITPEYLAQIRKQKGSKGLKEFTDTQGFLTEQKKSASQMGNVAMDNESKLRGDYTKASTNFKTVSENLQTIQSVAQKPPSAAGDISLVFSYMKLMDPNSTVREGEYATAASAAGAGDRMRALYNKLLDGQTLAPTQRANFINTSGDIYQGWLDKQKQTDDSYRGIATRSGVNPENVLVPFGVPNFDRAALARSPGGSGTAGGGGGGAPPAGGGMVRVKSPDGKVGSIPRGNLAKAQQRGYSVVQ